MEEYPRLQKAQRMLESLNRALTDAEQEGMSGVMVTVVRGHPFPKVILNVGGRQTDLADNLGLSGAETVGLFGWLESAGYIKPHFGDRARNAPWLMGSLEYLEREGYELIGELPNPQDRLAFVLEAAIRATRKDASLGEDEKKRRIDWFEEAKIAVRTLTIEVAKGVWKGDLPTM